MAPRLVILFAAAVLAAALYFFMVPPNPLTGTVSEVVSGDTLKLVSPRGQTFEVKLAGVMAPPVSEEFGQDSWANLQKMALRQSVTVSVLSRKGHLQLEGTVRKEHIDFGAEQLLQGYAWQEPSTNRLGGQLESIYKTSQSIAQREQAGMWASFTPTAPWNHPGASQRAL
jgi:endonuclease YncB( thermonuclease family)